MRGSSKLMLAAALLITTGAAVAGPADDQVASAFNSFNAAFNKQDAKPSRASTQATQSSYRPRTTS